MRVRALHRRRNAPQRPRRKHRDEVAPVLVGGEEIAVHIEPMGAAVAAAEMVSSIRRFPSSTRSAPAARVALLVAPVTAIRAESTAPSAPAFDHRRHTDHGVAGGRMRVLLVRLPLPAPWRGKRDRRDDLVGLSEVVSRSTKRSSARCCVAAGRAGRQSTLAVEGEHNGREIGGRI